MPRPTTLGGQEHFDRPVVAPALSVLGDLWSGATSVMQLSAPGFPASGPTGAGAGDAPAGSVYTDTTRGTLWVNVGSLASPYWVPRSFDQDGLFAINAPDFLGSDGKALADVATSVVLAPSGFTVLGDGVHEGDSGAVVQAAAENIPPPIRLTTSDAIGDLAALCTPIVAAAGIYQPDANGMAIMDVLLTNVTDLLDRIVYVGFSGLAPAGQTDVVTAAGTVTTNVEPDLAGLYMDSTATDADRIIAAHNAGGATASVDYAVTTELNTGVDMAAAATAQRLRVEIDGDGGFRMFIAKAQVLSKVAATLDVDEELNALVYVSPTTTSVSELDVLRAFFVMGR